MTNLFIVIKWRTQSNSAQSINEFDVYGYDVLYNVIEKKLLNIQMLKQ